MSIETNSTPQGEGEVTPVAGRGKHSAAKNGAEEKLKKKKRRSHRAQFPTPEFYLFAFLLNLGAVLFAGWLLVSHPANIPLLATGLLGVIGLVISVYSIALKPTEANKKLRKTLVAVTAAFGVVLLIVHAINILMNPTTFIF